MSFNFFSIFNNAEQCQKRHLYVCPQFDKNGKCPKSKYCPYPHKLRENLTLNLEHMHRCIGDIPEVIVNEDEPKSEEFRYFHFKVNAKDNDLDTNSGVQTGIRGESPVQVENGLEVDGKGGGEMEIDLNVKEEVIKRRRFFDEFFNLIRSRSDLTVMDDTQWKILESKMRRNHQIESILNVETRHELVGVDEESELQIKTDQEIEFQMMFVDKLLRQTRSDFKPVDDDEWENIECSKKTTHKHREEIRRLLLERAKDRQWSKNTEGISVEDSQVVTAEWIHYIIRQCKVVRGELEALYPNEIDGEGEGCQEIRTLILSTLRLTDKICNSLWKLVNIPANETNNIKNHQIDMYTNTYRISPCLVKLLQDLLSHLVNKKKVFKWKHNKHLPPQISCDTCDEASSVCTYTIQDVGDENDIQDEIATCSKSELNIDTSSGSEDEQNVDLCSMWSEVDIAPSYISLN